MHSDTPGRFIEKFANLSGKTCRATNPQDVVRYVMEVITFSRAECIALGALPEDLARAIATECEQQGVRVLRPPYSRESLPSAIDGAQVGIALVPNAIAETGTLIEVTTDDSLRLVSALPRVYIGLVEASNVLPDYTNAASVVRRAFAENPDSCVVSFISGPSRTGDIELKLTLGVHGPEEAHAVVLDYSR